MSSRVAAWLVGVAAVVAGFALWYGENPSIPVEVASAERGPLRVTIVTNGAVEPIDKLEVRARLDGRILEIPDPGRSLEAGEVLLRIDAGPVAAELAAAESERVAARDSLRSARDTLRRVRRLTETDRELFEQGGITLERRREGLAELEEARARASSLEREVPLRLASLRLRIAELTAQRDEAEVRAPFAGTVYRGEAKRGEAVRVGDRVLWFADLERLQVRTNVDQVDLGSVEVGQIVRIASNAYPDRTWSATVSELIPNVVMKQSRYVAEGLARVAPPTAGLVPGMTVDVEITAQAVANALQVPSDAVFTDAAGAFVYRVNDDRVHQTRVSVGRTTVATVEILGGLEAGDQVVIGPVAGLVEGAKVVVQAEDHAGL
jgi:HlyD family secretion protein